MFHLLIENQVKWIHLPTMETKLSIDITPELGGGYFKSV